MELQNGALSWWKCHKIDKIDKRQTKNRPTDRPTRQKIDPQTKDRQKIKKQTKDRPTDDSPTDEIDKRQIHTRDR